MEFHWPGYQYMGPGTHLEKRLARGDPGINRLDRIAKAHYIDYGRAKDLKEKWHEEPQAVIFLHGIWRHIKEFGIEG